MKNILVTGGAGFIGANLVEYLLENTEDKIINLDKLTYAADLTNLEKVNSHKNYKFVEGDICDAQLIEKIFNEEDITDVIHLAAESHVDNSISGPEVFIDTNVKGSFNLIHRAFLSWMENPHEKKAGFESSRFLHVSTDEVYGTLGDTGLFTEETPYAPNSPYSASKASSDMIIRSYHHTFGMNTVITNCSNNYGPYQHKEKLIPTIIRKAISGEDIPVYGDGRNVRDWLYVKDHCSGISLAFDKGVAGETYNVGGRNERQNIDIVKDICSILDSKKPKASGEKYESQIRFVRDRPGHDQRYAIDATKLEGYLGWRARENFTSGIEKTIDWYLKE